MNKLFVRIPEKKKRKTLKSTRHSTNCIEFISYEFNITSIHIKCYDNGLKRVSNFDPGSELSVSLLL